METAKIGRLCVKLVVPSSGSIIHVNWLSFVILFVSSEIIECVGYVSFILEIIRYSDSVSAFVRRSILVDFLDREDRFPKQANWIYQTC